ncbi:MAG: lactonase family protein [Chitinophagaceae bacterium]|nr:lactonase family protein [Chitinophagaceae bacterium]
MKKILICFLLQSILLIAYAQKSAYLLVGTYTSGKSEGIYVYKFNAVTGKAEFVSVAKSVNPSYLTISPDGRYVFAANETSDSQDKSKGGNISSFYFDKKSGQLNFINTVPSGGADPCYVTIDKSAKWVITGNYTSGSLAVIPIAIDGRLGNPTQSIEHIGSGPNKNRQQSPHVHSTVLSKDNKFLFASDLGIDKVVIYSFNTSNGEIGPATQNFAEAEKGSGPRHFEFHPNNKYAYLMEELVGAVKVFSYDAKKGTLEPVQTISSIEKKFKASNFSADIHISPDGKFLYCTNRGESNTIALCSIDPSSGMLQFIKRYDTGGKIPRNFSIDPSGQFLLVANQQSDNIVVFKRNKDTGELTDTNIRIETGNPVCLKWIEE